MSPPKPTEEEILAAFDETHARIAKLLHDELVVFAEEVRDESTHFGVANARLAALGTALAVSMGQTIVAIEAVGLHSDQRWGIATLKAMRQAIERMRKSAQAEGVIP